jgi:hypothetical protein
MNEYAARSMLIDISAGQRIVVVERDYVAVGAAVQVFAEENERIEWGATVRRSNGAERIAHPGGGWIVFATPRSDRMRGLSADVVFIDNDADRVVLDGGNRARFDRFRGDIEGVLAASPYGKVVHS